MVMTNDPYQDASILESQQLETGADADVDSDTDPDQDEVNYTLVRVAYEDGDIVFTPRHSSSDTQLPARFSTTEETVEALSTWFRTVTHQVLRFARSSGRKDHITLRGTSICTYSVRVGTRDPPFGVITPSSQDDSPYRWYVPVDRLNNTALSVNVCTGCQKELKRLGFTRRSFDAYYRPAEAVPRCPNCGNEVVAFRVHDSDGPRATHDTPDNPDAPDYCELSRREVKELLSQVLGVPVDAESRYDPDAPHEYLTDFPAQITEQTGGLTAGYCQPVQENTHRAGKTPDSFAGVFDFSHPDWNEPCVLNYDHWKRSNIYDESETD